MRTVFKELEWRRTDLGRWCAELHTWDSKRYEAIVCTDVELGVFRLSIMLIDEAPPGRRDVIVFLEHESLTIAQHNAMNLIHYSLTVRERLLKPEPDRKLS
jgi:hypothetical protein